MQVILQGNFLSARSGRNKDGEAYYMISLLSGDDSVRVSFDSETVSDFRRIEKSKRLDEVSLFCDLNIYNGNAYFRAIPSGPFVDEKT